MKYGELNLGQIEALVNKLGGMEGVKRVLAGNVEMVIKTLLSLVSTIQVPAVEHFVAAEKFRKGETTDGVKIAWLGENFKKHFLPKIEKGDVAAEELAVNKLLENAFDPAIITALGGEAKVEITLGQFFSTFAKQSNGEKGQLLTNGYANVGYIRDTDGVLWAVFGRWYDDGWNFAAAPLDDPRRWRAGAQFLSR